jgi:hypothetical protein
MTEQTAVGAVSRARRLRPSVALWVRAADAQDYVDAFLISTITTILVVRLFLIITGYPKLGGDSGLHIAHLLWGGLLMLTGLVIAMALITRAARHVSAVVGGIGFGLFIDEMGKFVTSDNNYFFKPTFSMIYVVLVLLWVATRRLFVKKGLTRKEALANAIDELKESVIRHVNERERRRALHFCEQAESHDLTHHIVELLRKIETVPTEPPPMLHRLVHRLSGFYWRRVVRPEFATVVVVVFIVLTGLQLYRAGDLLWIAIDAATRNGATADSVDRAVNGAGLGFSGWATLGSSLLVSVCYLVGIVALFRGSRLVAFRWLEHGLLISIFLAQVFNFATLQLLAFALLSLDLLLFATVRFMLTQEEHRKQGIHVPAPA